MLVLVSLWVSVIQATATITSQVQRQINELKHHNDIIQHHQNKPSTIPILVQLIPSEIHELQQGSRMASLAEMETHAHALVSQLNRHATRTSRNVKGILDDYVTSTGIKPYRFYPISNTFAVEATPELIKLLANQPQVEEISSNNKVKMVNSFEVSMEDSAVWTGKEVHWSIDYINATKLPSGIYKAAGDFVYANADTGVEFNHPALAHTYLGLSENGDLDHNYAWWDANHGESNPFAPCPTNSSAPCDDEGHGSHTTGTVIGRMNIGISPTTKWMACKNMYQNFGSPESYLGCLQFFLAPTDLNGKNPQPSKRPHVVGNSYGCPAQEGCSQTTFKYALRAMKAAGIFMSVSAGNDGRGGCSTVNAPPATDPNSFTVAATQYQSNLRADFSSLGPVPDNPKGAIDIAAPGVNITSSITKGRYASFQGTSMASPHIAGAVLLITGACPHLIRNIPEIIRTLHITATPLLPHLSCGDDTPTTIPNNEFGYGLVNVGRAIHHCQTHAPQP